MHNGEYSDVEEAWRTKQEGCRLTRVENNVNGRYNGVAARKYRVKNYEADGEGSTSTSATEPRVVARITSDEQALRDVSTGTQLLLHERFPDDVQIAKVKGHYIFTVESIGQLSAPALFSRALAHLSEKCRITCEVLRKKMAAEGGSNRGGD